MISWSVVLAAGAVAIAAWVLMPPDRASSLLGGVGGRSRAAPVVPPVYLMAMSAAAVAVATWVLLPPDRVLCLVGASALVCAGLIWTAHLSRGSP